MIRLSMIWAAILGATQIAARDATRLWTRIVMFTFVMIALVILEGFANAFIAPEVNYIFFFLGIVLILLLGLSPAGFAVGAGAGTVFAVLRDTDLSQGAYRGLILTYRVTINIAFWWAIVSGALATWPLEHAPEAIFPIAASCIVLLVAVVYFNMKANLILKPAVFLYATAVLLLGVWETMPLHWRPWQEFDTATGKSGFMVGTITGQEFPFSPEECTAQGGCFSPTTGERLRPGTPNDKLGQRNVTQNGRQEASSTWNRAEADCVGLGTWTIPLQPNRRSGPICSPPRRQAPNGIDLAIELDDPSVRITYHLILDGMERKVVHEPGENQHVAIGDFDILYISAEQKTNVKVKLEATKPSA